jgi:hypothetical protein
MNRRLLGRLVPALFCVVSGCGTKEGRTSNDSLGEAKQALGDWTNWFSIGPTGFNNNFNMQGTSNWSGRVLDYEWSRGLIATSRGGLWKAGSPATNLTDGKIGTTMVIGAVARKPGLTSSTYVVGTGEAARQYGDGIWYSPDSGGTWTQASKQGGGSMTDAVTGNVFRIKFDPVTTTTCHAATGRGYFRSTNSGATWSPITIRGTNDTVSDIAVNPQNPQKLYAALWGAGIWKTTSGGNAGTWTQVANGLPSANLDRISIAVAPSSPNIIYALIGNGATGSFFDVYVSTNEGTSWVSTGSWPATDGKIQEDYNNTIAVSPDNPSVVLAGAQSLFHYNGTSPCNSMFGPCSWVRLDSFPNQAAIHADQHVITWGPSGSHPQVIVGNDGGLASSDDWGVTWTATSQALPITQFYDMDVGRDAPTSDVVLGASQDTGMVVTHDSGQVWTNTWLGDGETASIDPTNSQNMWLTGHDDARREKSIDQGQHWSPAWGGIPCTGTTIAVIRNDQGNPPQLYTNNCCNGHNRVYRSFDKGDTWTAVGSVICGGLDLPGPVINISVPVRSTNPVRVYAVLSDVDTSMQIWALSETTCSSWSNASGSLPSGQQVDTVVQHPSDANTIYAIMSGSAGANKLWRSRNQGAAWTNITGNLPDDGPMIREVSTSLAVHPGDDSIVFVGLRKGIYATSNANAASPTWVAWNKGMGVSNDGIEIPLQVSAIRGIDRRAIDGTFWLVASTYGRSMWERGPL